jgi:hypothetical protein
MLLSRLRRVADEKPDEDVVYQLPNIRTEPNTVVESIRLPVLTNVLVGFFS